MVKKETKHPHARKGVNRAMQGLQFLPQLLQGAR